MFTAITLDEPVVALNYTSGDDLINQTSFTGAAMAAGEYPRGGRPRRPAAAQRGAPAAGAARPRRAPRRVQVQQRVVYDKVGRNDPCPCGSGKKYKKCHGA